MCSSWTFFLKVLKQMSVINFMDYSLSTAAGFVPSHAPLKSNKHLNIPFQSTQQRRGKNKSESQGLTPSSRVCAWGTKRGSRGRASILSVMPNTAPDTHPLSSPSPLAFNLSQHQGLFQWVSSSHQVAKVLEFQLQHQSFQWTVRTNFL